jgi:hypothetical protein
LTGYTQEAIVPVTGEELVAGYRKEVAEMELLGSVVLVVAVVALFELAAAVWGVDSREGAGDDHQRSSEGGA